MYCKIKDSIRQKQRGQQLEEELKLRETELENVLNKQKEVGILIVLLIRSRAIV